MKIDLDIANTFCQSLDPSLCRGSTVPSVWQVHSKTLLILFKDLFARWVDRVFHAQYLSSLSLDYVVINKDLDKLPLLLY